MPCVRPAIVQVLNAHGPLSLDQVARAVNLSNMAARYHLGLLIDEGFVLAQRNHRPGTVGRPHILYGLTGSGRDRLPKQYDALAVELLDEMVAMWGTEESRELLRRTGRHLAAKAPPLRDRAGIAARTRRATEFLSARGYTAAADGNVLILRNCPYGAVARDHPEVCELDIALISALLLVPVTLTGGDGCRFAIAGKR